MSYFDQRSPLAVIKGVWIRFLSVLTNFTFPYFVTVACHRMRGVKVGKGTHICRGAYLDDHSPQLIEIGKGVGITQGVVIICHQRDLTNNLAHDLKTPVTVILANNSILLKHSQDSIASQSQWIESTQVEAQNMQGLVNEMLELAQVESRAAIEHSMLDFSDLVDGIALQFESVAFERGCEYRENVKEGLLVDGDESRLRKAVSTLIENALKYVDEKGVVTITLRANDRKSILEISNTGTAISKEDIPHIFDRFYRTDKARTSGTGGYGLGCESNEKAGTVFTMTLPLVIVK